MRRILVVAVFLASGFAASSLADTIGPLCYVCETHILDLFNKVAECKRDSTGLYSECNVIEVPHTEAGGVPGPTPVAWEECRFRVWECNKSGTGDGGGNNDPWWGAPLEDDPCNTGGWGYCSAECRSCY